MKSTIYKQIRGFSIGVFCLDVILAISMHGYLSDLFYDLGNHGRLFFRYFSEEVWAARTWIYILLIILFCYVKMLIGYGFSIIVEKCSFGKTDSLETCRLPDL